MHSWVQCVGENFQRIHQPRAGAAEIRRAVDGVDTLRSNARQCLPARVVAENRQIGERMYLAEKTVKNYVSSMLAKLGLHSRTQAAIFATKHPHT